MCKEVFSLADIVCMYNTTAVIGLLYMGSTKAEANVCLHAGLYTYFTASACMYICVGNCIGNLYMNLCVCLCTYIIYA